MEGSGRAGRAGQAVLLAGPVAEGHGHSPRPRAASPSVPPRAARGGCVQTAAHEGGGERGAARAGQLGHGQTRLDAARSGHSDAALRGIDPVRAREREKGREEAWRGPGWDWGRGRGGRGR